jgi:hypothetical protein
VAWGLPRPRRRCCSAGCGGGQVAGRKRTRRSVFLNTYVDAANVSHHHSNNNTVVSNLPFRAVPLPYQGVSRGTHEWKVGVNGTASNKSST